MQDRYLSRGRRIDNGEWITGCLIYDEYCGSEPPQIGYLSSDGGDFDSVDPATVGQCTGLRDKNGTLIFEGDILSDGKNKYVVEYSEFGTGIHARAITDRENIWSLYHLVNRHNEGREIEIIGNIHDNPEYSGTAKGGEA